MKLTDLSKCKTDYQGLILESQLCVDSSDGKDSCQGDSGGPLVCTGTSREGCTKQVLAGIVSYGTDYAAGYGAVYTAVSYFQRFIDFGSSITETPTSSTSKSMSQLIENRGINN